MVGLDDFLVASHAELSNHEKWALYIVWYLQFVGREGEATVKFIADTIQRHGHSRPNVTRLKSRLISDGRITVSGSTIRLTPKARHEFDALLSARVTETKAPPPSDSVLPRELFHNMGTYIEKVVYQINASYDYGLYDCCAVMSRRLLETLIIEIYERYDRASEIKNKQDNFFMFGDLLAQLEKDGSLNFSRNAKNGLRDFKKLGDLSAHNRRYNAVRNDIDRFRDGIRVAVGEMVALIELKSKRPKTNDEFA